MCISMDACLLWTNMNNNNPFIILLFFISLFSLLLNIYQSIKINGMIEKFNRKSINKNTSMVSESIPMKPYRMLHIDETTIPIEIEELFVEAKRTYTITVFPFGDMNDGMHYLQVELVQERWSIVIHIEFFTDHNILLPQIDELL